MGRNKDRGEERRGAVEWVAGDGFNPEAGFESDKLSVSELG